MSRGVAFKAAKMGASVLARQPINLTHGVAEAGSSIDEEKRFALGNLGRYADLYVYTIFEILSSDPRSAYCF